MKIMNKLPIRLLWLIAIVGLIAFAGGEYAEWFQPNWLGQHSITSNIIANVVGFATAAVVLGVGLNKLTERAEARDAEHTRDAATTKFLAATFRLAYGIERCIPERSATPRTTAPNSVIPWLKQVLADVSRIKITSSAQLTMLYDRASDLLHNELRTYVEVYLLPAAILGRKTIVEAESAIWNGEIFVASGQEEGYGNAINNLGYFCNRVLMVLRGLEEVGALSTDATEQPVERCDTTNLVVERAIREYVQRIERGG